jgi:hypothetical protein
MYKLLTKILRADMISMLLVYFFDLLISIFRIYLLWGNDGLDYQGMPLTFLAFFSFGRGVAIVIDTLLIGSAFAHGVNKIFTEKYRYLLLVYSVIGIATLISLAFYYTFFSVNFWIDGYAIMITMALSVTVYLRRYLIMSATKEQILHEDGDEE